MARSPTSLDPGKDADPRKRQAAGDWRRRSQRIHFWRRALPLVIVAIAGMLVLWVAGRSLIVRLTTPSGAAAGVKMVNPRFYGRDTSNRAFVLGASEASRNLVNEQVVTLSGPNMTLDSDGANPTHVEAQRGAYSQDKRRLVLDGQVNLKDGRGYDFTTPNATVDTSSGVIAGNSGVKGVGPLGRVAASSYGVYDRGERIIMKGDVRAHIVQ